MAPAINTRPLAFRGNLVHTPQYGVLDMLIDKIVIVADGKIAKIAAGSEEATVLAIWGVDPSETRRLAEGEFLMPGLIDTHVHAPQVGGGVVRRPLHTVTWACHVYPCASAALGQRTTLAVMQLMLSI
jgi:guanine deaminase